MSEEYRIIDANDNVTFRTKTEAINWCTGSDYDLKNAWRPACWPSNRPKNKEFRIWFVKLAVMNNGEYIPGVEGCINKLIDNGNCFIFDDIRTDRVNNGGTEFLGYNILFTKDSGDDYVLRGVYLLDSQKSHPNHHVFKRIATKLKLIGKPAEKLELVDDFYEQQIVDDINSPRKPRNIVYQSDGIIQYTCGRCDAVFIRAARCPECGQLVKE